LSQIESSPPARLPGPTACWIAFCALCNCAGWALSALHALNAAGYLAVFGLTGALLIVLRHRFSSLDFAAWRFAKLKRRFRRPFALAFLALAGLAALGGILYAPSNYDAMAYRLPRVFNWLADGRWHWIHTTFQRLNVRAMGYEWVSTPFIVLTHTDRFLFLVNVISFLLLPGLVFSVFTRLGVRPRAAWHWMWITPAGYCFVLQAGSNGNDLFGAVFALAAVDFALRARVFRNPGAIWVSVLAVALLTGSKSSNLPLVLPWLVAILPAWRVSFRRPIATALVCAAAFFSSLGPSAAANFNHCRDWTGLAAEGGQFSRGSPALYVANNAVLLVIQNGVPPVFPFAEKWNQAVQRHVPASFRSRLEKCFERNGAHWALEVMQIEESAGLGFGVSVLLVCSLVAGAIGQMGRMGLIGPMARTGAPWFPRVFLVCGGIALAAYMAKAGLSTAARLITPYYAMLMPAFLLSPAQGVLVRKPWWRALAWLVFGLSAMLVALSPARPLWPANTILARLEVAGHPLLARARTVYAVYGNRAEGFAPMRAVLPESAQVVGLITSDDPESSLWRPFLHRRFVHLTPQDTAAALRDSGIEYIVVSSEKFEQVMQRPFDQWLAETHGTVVQRVPLALRAGEGPRDWLLVRLGAMDGKP
jgi:hypothetical protein